MKTTLALLLVFAALPLRAVTLSANFDGLSPSAVQEQIIQEGGLTFSSPSAFGVASGYFGAVLFGWGGYVYAGNALYVNNAGWVSIDAGGSPIDSLSFKYGFDWSGYAIEYGILTTTFGWQALAAGQVVASGSQTSGAGFHGGATITVNPGPNFDTLQIRSTSNLYGNANHIAFDDVAATLAAPQVFAAVAAVPDSGATLVLLCCALGVVAGFRRLYASAPARGT